MATKLAKNVVPDGHTVHDFEAFGPVATRDTEFAGCRMADLGCFQQETVDSNKFYHLAAVRSKINGQWYAYYQWGRTRDGRPDKPSFQFFACTSEQDAMKCCEKQFHEKNTKRGKWEKIGSKERYIPNGKDLYVVRAVARRLVGLPAAENVANEDAKGIAAPVIVKSNGVKKSRSVDPQTEKLFRDLLGGAVTYTRNVMSGGKGGKVSLPTLASIEEAREILDDAMAQLKVIGSNKIEVQVADKTLKHLTYQLYGKIPKAKPPGVSEAEWILSQENVGTWRLDLDAFETALQAEDLHVEETGTDVMSGIPAKVCWIDPRSQLGEWLMKWLPLARRDRNNLAGRQLRIHNLWQVDRDGDVEKFRQAQQQIQVEIPPKWKGERPCHQETNRFDLSVVERKLYWDTNTALTIHGSRSCNIPGIIKESFRLPKELVGVVINGALMGPGVYQADSWQKSANYCSTPGAVYGGDGGVKGRKSFMLLCDTICGVPYLALKAHGYTSPPAGHHSVFAKAGVTESWGRAGGLLENEWIVYRKDRVIIRYLAEVSW